MKTNFYHEGSRRLQESFDSRRLGGAYDPARPGAWKDPAKIKQGISNYSDEFVDCMVEVAT